MYRNCEGYADPTVGAAFAHIEYEERQAQKKRDASKRVHRSPVKRLNRSARIVNLAGNTTMDCFTDSHRQNSRLPGDVREEAVPTGSKNKKTGTLKDSTNPWKTLAGAVILQAIKDFRSQWRMICLLKNKLKNKAMTVDEADYLMQRLHKYEALQKATGDFFLSEVFAQLCDLDGKRLLNQLVEESES